MMPSRRRRRFVCLRLSVIACSTAGSASGVEAGRVLFDATKAQMAGNADWVIDSDAKLNGESNPMRFSTPAAGGITASTPETYWNGGISAWGVTMVKHGNAVESLPRVGGSISYGNASNAQDLSRYKTLVVCEPNNLFTMTQKAALVNFVAGGGGLFIVADHNGSDRDNDGVDSVDVWNDLFTNNGVANNPFGMAVNYDSFSQVSTNVNAAAPFRTGTEGTAANLEFNAGASFTISTAANPSVAGAVWKSGTRTNANLMMAYATYGLGRVVALGDSSPADDGTGDTADNLFFGWDEGTNGALISNATDWLGASAQSTYDAPGGGSFATASAWTGGVPDGNGFVVDFKNFLAAPATVTLDRNRSAATLRFDSTRAYTIAGTATLTFGATPALPGLMPGVVVTSGSHAIATPLVASGRAEIDVVNASSTLTIGTLTAADGFGFVKDGPGRWVATRLAGRAAFTVSGGAFALGGAATTPASTVGTLVIASGATVDLGTGALAIDYASPSPLATIRTYLADARLTTTAAGLTVGYAEANALNATNFAGIDVDATTLLLRATRAGDADLDLAVGFADLVALAQHYGQSSAAVWSDGDFDRSGTVDFADLVALAQNYGQGGLGSLGTAGFDASFAADWALARSLVPEPAALLAAAPLAVAARRRRR